MVGTTVLRGSLDFLLCAKCFSTMSNFSNSSIFPTACKVSWRWTMLWQFCWKKTFVMLAILCNIWGAPYLQAMFCWAHTLVWYWEGFKLETSFLYACTLWLCEKKVRLCHSGRKNQQKNWYPCPWLADLRCGGWTKKMTSCGACTKKGLSISMQLSASACGSLSCN